MAFSTSTHTNSSEINVTPLIDVLLVLLIIFMVIVPVAPRGLDTRLPQKALDPNLTDPSIPVTLDIASDASGPAYRLDGRPVARESLDASLREALRTRADRQVLVRADPGFAFSIVADAVDRGRAAGAETIGLLTPRSQR